MPLVRVHKASDGKFFENYGDYVAHQESLNFQNEWSKAFKDESNEAHFAFVKQNKDVLIQIIEKSKVKHKGGRKK